ncbi:MAG: PKD domain-containing protein [Bacteroidota bacterium]
MHKKFNLYKSFLIFTTLLLAPIALLAQLNASFTVSSDTICSEPTPVVTFTNTSTNYISFLWDFGDGIGTNDSIVNPTYNYFNAGPGTYDVILTVYDGPNQTGNSDQATITITVVAPPVIDFTVTSSEVCKGDTVCFTALVSGGIPPFTYLWTSQDGWSSTSQNPCHQFNSPANCPNGCDIFLQVTDAFCLKKLDSNDVITVHNLPTANFNVSPNLGGTPPVVGCNPPANVQFTDASTAADAPVSSWQWDFNYDGITFNIDATGNTVNNTYNSAGSFDVALAITDDNGCVDTIIKTIRIDDYQAGFETLTPTTGCENLIVAFADTTFSYIQSSAYPWYWDFTLDGNFTLVGSSTTGNFYSTPGTYSVALVSTNGICTDTVVVSDLITIYPLPDAGFFTDTLISCSVPFDVTFTDTTASAPPGCLTCIWEWDIDNWDPLIPDYDWSWDYDTSTFTNTYNAPGFYNVSLIVTDTNGCVSTIIKDSLIRITLPIANFEADTFDFTSNITEGCLPLKINFRDLSIYDTTIIPGDSIVTWYWDFGDGYTIEGGDSAIPDSTNDCLTKCTYRNPTHYYVDTGSFTVTLAVITLKGCSDTIFAVELVKAGIPPIAEFTVSDTVGCQPFETNFYDMSSTFANDWYWDFGDDGTDNTEDPTHEYTDTGYFDVFLIAIFNSCPSDTLIKPKYIQVEPPKPLFDVQTLKDSSWTTDPYFCFGDTLPTGGWQISITDLSEGAEIWIWNFGDTNTTYNINDTIIFYYDTTFVPADTIVNAGDTMFFTAGDTSICDTVFEVIRPLDSITVEADTILPTPSDTDTVIIRGDIMHYIGMPTDTIIISPDTIIIYHYTIIPQLDTIIDSTYTIYMSDEMTIITADTVFGCDTMFTQAAGMIITPGDTIFTLIATDTLYYIPHDSVVINTIMIFSQPDTIYYNSGDTIVSVSPDNIVIGNDTLLISADTIIIDTTLIFVPLDTIFLGFDTIPADTTTDSTTITVPSDSVLSGCDTVFIAADTTTTYDTTITDTILLPFKYTYMTPGTKTITLYTLRECIGCPDSICIDSIKQDIYISQVDAEFSVTGGSISDTSSCGFFVAQFTNQTSSIYPQFACWDFGDSQTDCGSPISHTYLIPGIYTVTMFATDQYGCMDSISHQIAVKELPAPKLVADTTDGCVNDVFLDDLEVTFTDTSTHSAQIMQWIWNYEYNYIPNDTTFIPVSSPHEYTSCGSFNVWLRVIDEFGCQGDDYKLNYITTTCPNPYFSGPDMCNGTPVNFASACDSCASGPITYYWDWCDGSSVDSTSTPIQNHTFINLDTVDSGQDTTTFYNVILTVVDANGCRADTTTSVTIYQPVADFLDSSAISDCPEHVANFYDLSSPGVVLWNWSFGDGDSLNNIDFNPVSHTYSDPGSYDVQMVITDGFGCTDTMFKPDFIKVGGPILIDTTIIDTATCAPYQVTFIVDAYNAEYYYWYFGDGGMAEGDTVVYYYTNAGVFYPNLMLEDTLDLSDPNDSTCKRTFSLPPITVPGPKIGFFTNDTICGPRWVSFIDTSINSSDVDLWEWDFGDGYTIQGTGNIPTGTNNNLTTGTYQNPIHYYSDTGIYDVIQRAYVIGNDTCIYEAPKEKYIVVFGFPYTNIYYCPPLTVTFTADSITIDPSKIPYNLDSLIWHFGDGDSLMGYSVPHTYPSTGDTFNITYYTITAILDNNCRFVFDNLVAVYPTPFADFYIDPAITGITVAINAINTSIGADSLFRWDFDDGETAFSSPLSPNATHAYTDTGLFTIQLVAINKFGCTDTTTQEKHIELKIPNVFMPGSDPDRPKENSVFYIGDFYLDTMDFSSATLKLVVFNRWGQKVYENDHYEECDPWGAPEKCWDGTDLNGRELNTDTYYYILNFDDRSAVNGWVMILRPK